MFNYPNRILILDPPLWPMSRFVIITIIITITTIIITRAQASSQYYALGICPSSFAQFCMLGIVSRIAALLVLCCALAVRDGGRIPDEADSSLSAQAQLCSRPGANTARQVGPRPLARSVAPGSADLAAPTVCAEVAHFRPSHSSRALLSEDGLLNGRRHVDTEKQIERSGGPAWCSVETSSRPATSTADQGRHQDTGETSHVHEWGAQVARL